MNQAWNLRAAGEAPCAKHQSMRPPRPLTNNAKPLPKQNSSFGALGKSQARLMNSLKSTHDNIYLHLQCMHTSSSCARSIWRLLASSAIRSPTPSLSHSVLCIRRQCIYTHDFINHSAFLRCFTHSRRTSCYYVCINYNEIKLSTRRQAEVNAPMPHTE